MSRNGVGIYSLPATYNPVVTNTPISIAWANTTLTDIQTAITNSIASNGETVITANLPMATYKHTNVGNASARTDYAAAGQIQDGSLIWCGTATGTANALILTASPVITAVTAGMTLRFKAGASPNSGATTVTIGGAAAIAVQNNGAACVGGEIAANKWYEITVDGSLTSCQLKKIGSTTYAELGIVSPASGGTGVANNAASTITISGAFASTFTLTNTTSVTFPTSGTLLSTAAAITVAQGGTGVATLAAHGVVVGNGASVVSVTGAGSIGQVLTSNGASADPTFQDAVKNGIVFLSSVTASSSATVDIETTFDGTYDVYVIEAVGVTQAGAGQISARFKLSGAYVTTSTYAYHTSIPSSASASYSGLSNGASSSLLVTPASTGTIDFTMTITKPTSATTKRVHWKGNSSDVTPVVASFSGAGSNSGTGALTGVRFFFGSGNVDSGTFRLYGIKNS